jgi:CBS domain-containing protein
MQIREVMTPQVTTVRPNSPLVEIARIMRDEDIGAVPVTDNEQLLGMVTDRDIVVRALVEGHDGLDRTAADAEALEALVRSEAGVRPLEEEEGRGAYLLPALAAQTPPSLGTPVPTRALHDSPRRVVFELARPGPVGGVQLEFGGGVSDLPSRVTVEVGDTQAWMPAWDGPVAALALRGALLDPRRVPVALEFPPASGRLVRVVVAGDVRTIDGVVAFRPREH